MATKTTTKRGRQIVTPNKQKPVLKLAVHVQALTPKITFGTDVNGYVIAWNGNKFMGDNFTLEDFANAL